MNRPVNLKSPSTSLTREIMASPGERLKNAKIFELNLIETIQCSRNATPASQRNRINETTERIPAIPTTRDFIALVNSTAVTFEHEAGNLKIIGKLLKQNISDSRKTEQVNIFQNMFDGFRYSSALMKNISALEIPVEDHSL